jgi:hypothetical protein
MKRLETVIPISTDGLPPRLILSAGYRTDTLNWHIAGNLQGTDPNVLSELTWSDLKIYQLKLANRTVIKNHVYLRGHLDFGAVIVRRQSGFGLLWR